ncbi:DUF6913 domain-containing protein [Formosa sp. S-31]|uniref:DUF6913 domain-containing protein n=1 Tax=Formosa sp. S-31 TaxID=2790949 RepID=UPI003EBD796A
MILKGFKEKSIKKYFNKLLENRVLTDNSKPIESLGVILDYSEISQVETLENLSKTLKINSVKFKVVAFNTAKDYEQGLCPVFSEDDFDWKGQIKTAELKAFLNTPFDALISYYFKDDLHLKLLTAMSEAKFKIGVLQEEPKLNDLIIATDSKAFEVFKSELLKYLSILKRI